MTKKKRKKRPQRWKWWHFALVGLIAVGFVLLMIAGGKTGKGLKTTKRNLHATSYIVTGGVALAIDDMNYQNHNP